MVAWGVEEGVENFVSHSKSLGIGESSLSLGPSSLSARGFRLYNPAVGRFLSVDPLTRSYPELTPYQFASNRPIDGIDRDGLEWEEIKSAYVKGFDYATSLVKNTAEGLVELAKHPIDGAGALYTAGKETASDLGTMYGAGAKIMYHQVTGEPINIEGFHDAAHRNAKRLVDVAILSLVTEVAVKPVVKKARGNLPKCFVAGTLILTENGLIPIEEIEAGDEVWAYSDSLHIKDKKVVLQTIIRNATQITTIVADTDTIRCTPEHPFYVSNTWVEAGDLVVGDSVFLFDGSHLAIESIWTKDTSCLVYNFEVDGFHTYFVAESGVLVHNALCIDDILKLKESGNLTDFYKELDKFDFGNYLENTLGVVKPNNINRAHAHHIVMKKGGGEWSVKSRNLLEKYGIDPYFGKENFVWAPNGDGNHKNITAQYIYETLQSVESGGKGAIIMALKELGEKAAKGEFNN